MYRTTNDNDLSTNYTKNTKKANDKLLKRQNCLRITRKKLTTSDNTKSFGLVRVVREVRGYFAVWSLPFSCNSQFFAVSFLPLFFFVFFRVIRGQSRLSLQMAEVLRLPLFQPCRYLCPSVSICVHLWLQPYSFSFARRYPMPRTVCMYLRALPNFFLRAVRCTSMVLSVTIVSIPIPWSIS